MQDLTTTMAPLLPAMEVLASLLLLVLGLVLLYGVVLYVVDITQTRHAVRRNYPVIGRFRYLFEHLGEFFRQYFFAMDREEMPFNRAQRSWVYRASKGIGNTIAFGSTRDLNRPGNVLFVNHPYPALADAGGEDAPLTIGADCAEPFAARRFFNISAMSYGAISKVAVQALSRGAAEAGCWLNTGEGGLAPYHLEGGCDLVFQFGTGKFGVRDERGNLSEAKLREVAAHGPVRMIEVKLSQGAKPGKGGLLPGAKVTPEIAAVRGIPPGEDSISPNRHQDISSAGELLDAVARIRDCTGLPVGVKSVIGNQQVVVDWCEEILRRGPASAPDFLTVDSCDGGSGAAPMPLMDSVGLPLRESLPLVTDCLAAAGLRERVRVIASGKLINPTDVAWALCLGADFVNAARGFMFALGCIQALQCNRNTCPTGVTTHNRKLQQGLNPALKAVRVTNYARQMEREVRLIAHACGVDHPRQLNRGHARVVQASGLSVPLSDLHPGPERKAA